MSKFGREICRHWEVASNREWLVTNGIGGFASGTVAGANTRRYHGLLVASLLPPIKRTLLLSKLDETVSYNNQLYNLFSNVWNNSAVQADGLDYLELFRFEGTIPVWQFACSDAIIEKRVWMAHGTNTTYIRYDCVRGSSPIQLTIKALVNYRDFHGNTHNSSLPFQNESIPSGIKITAYQGAQPFYLLSKETVIQPQQAWYSNYFLPVEADRGLDPLDDNFYAASLEIELSPGQTMTLCASTEVSSNLDGQTAYAERQTYEAALIAQSHIQNEPDFLQRFILAADQFVVERQISDSSTNQIETGHSVIAGYHWFDDWGRDTMISLPGLTLTTQRYDIAASILRTFAKYVDQGMLPNLFPGQGRPLQDSDYNTVDATLWYFQAIYAYYHKTQDKSLIDDLYLKIDPKLQTSVLKSIIDYHLQGTRYNIKVDPTDNLVYAGENGVQLTWMDAKVGDWVVTPRMGKPIEISALWYNALCIMAEFAQLEGEDPGRFKNLASKTLQGFQRFWNEQVGYCFDVLDTPSHQNDSSLRPNQLIAISLPFSPLPQIQQRAVVEVCQRQLLASYGMRSLGPDEPAYLGVYAGDQSHRDAAYHQGTVWAWLIGPFVDAHLKVYGNPKEARSFLTPFVQHLEDAGLGSISEIFEGSAPFYPDGCIAQAWSIGEFLRAWEVTSPEEK